MHRGSVVFGDQQSTAGPGGRTCRAAWLAAGAMLWVLTVAVVGPQSAWAAYGPEVELSASIAHLLRTAEDAADRGDWKLAIDSLQRVIDKPEGLQEIAPNEELALYESPRRHAQRRLAELPAAGLAAYRVLYDGRAKGLLDQARRDFDPDVLRRLCDHYLMTRYGTEATGLLASWLLDLGRESEALLVLEELAEVYSYTEGLPPELELKRAAALALLGDQRGARSALDRARLTMGSESVADGLESPTAEAMGHPTEGDGAVGNTHPTDVFAAMNAFIEHAAARPTSGYVGTETGRAGRTEWSGPGGGGTCNGLMDHVVPSLAENLPWRREIPSVIPGVWPEVDVLRSNMLPVLRVVAADGRAFVKAGRECMAIDIHSFAVLWTSQSSVRGIAERVGRESFSSPASERDVLSDYVGGTLTTSHGLVFSVERGDRGPAFGADGVAVIGRRRGRPRDEGPDYSNRIVAYDAVTGGVRWQRGRSRDEDQRLQHAQFLAPPIGVGDHLWVPFATAGDLYLGVLAVSDGEMLHQILLCTLGGRPVQRTVALFPSAADGFVYVPSDHGLLFAVDADDFSLVWASRYTNSAAPRSARVRRPAFTSPAQWLSGPPVVAGRVVLLGPTDSDELLAFDRLTGRLLWRLPRRRHRYIIAADLEHVWLGGDDVSAASLWDHSYEWTVQTPGTTGRGILSGETIYVPTWEQLLAINAETGASDLSLDLPSDQTPLGNLLCIGGSMLSVDPSEVRAFPDRNSYASTLAAHQADPTDVRVSIRLAFLELMEKRPGRALEALSRVDPAGHQGRSWVGESQAAHVAHLRVSALMQLAEKAGTPGDQAITYLNEAVTSAKSNQDRVAAGMALGNKLRRLSRYAESYRTLWRLGNGPLGDEIITVDKTHRPARRVVADTLVGIEPELGTTEIEELAGEADELLAAALSKLESRATRAEGIGILRRLSDSRTLGGLGQEALNTLARFEFGRGKYERAEQYAHESLRLGSQRQRTAEALLILMDLYLTPSQSMVKWAADAAGRLLREFGDVDVDGEPVRSLVNRRLERIDSSLMAAHSEALDVPGFATTKRRVETALSDETNAALHLVRLRSERSEALADRQLVFLPPRTLRCYSVSDGELEWESDLLTENFAFGTEDQGGQEELMGADWQSVLLDGQTAIMNGPRGVHAVGVVSGKRLWARPVRGRVLLRDPVLRESTLDAARGLVACVLSPGVLSVVGVLDGRPVWEREVATNPAAVRIRDDVVLTADPKLETVQAYGADNGRLLATMVFRQPVSDTLTATYMTVPIVYSAGILCGPDGKALKAYDVRTGDQVWSLDLGDYPAGLFELDEGRFVVGTADGHHRVIEARSGEVTFEEELGDFPGGAIFGTADCDLLILAGYEETGEGDRWNLVGVDMKTGQVRWSRSFVGLMSHSHLRLAQGVIPVVVSGMRDQEPSQRREGWRSRQEVWLIDKQSGQNVGEPLVWDGVARGDQLTGELAIWPGRLVLQATQGIVMYETEPAALGVGGVD